MTDKPDGATPMPKKFGTFGGVFTPSLLTILGVIMFLLFPTVVGYAGLWGALLILLGAKLITVITGLSIASIATNMRVKGGGAYYLISRSLGVEFGGVIAIFFFIAQAVAVTLYVVGFTTAIFAAFPELGLSFRSVATLTNLAVFITVLIGAAWTIRLQYLILVVLLLSIASFLVGAAMTASPALLQANLASHWSAEFSPFVVFALFFPAVTGIMAGVNMSGDLRRAHHAIPLGTFAAIGVSAAIYIAIAVLLAASVPREQLLGEGFVMQQQALFPSLVLAGVIFATLSSALASMMGAPRILQAFARDNIFARLRWFGHGSGRRAEPRRAIVLTFIIAQVGVMVGDLNTIAPIITMFFLITYAAVNLACFYEGRSNNPSFRPTFRYNHWSIALFGALACVAVMFLINALWATVALLLAGLFYFFIARAEVQVHWGDMQGGFAFQLARNALLRLERERYHPKNWRPSILALSGGPSHRLHLIEYARWFTVDSGIVSVAQLIRGELEDRLARRHEAESILRRFLLREGMEAFPVVIVEEDINAAIKALLQCHGIGGIRPNTVLLGWSRDPQNSEVFYEAIHTVQEMAHSLIIVASEQPEVLSPAPSGAINIWWNDNQNIELMLLLAFMLKKNREWRDHPIRLLRTVAPRADIVNIEHETRRMLSLARIEAELVILPGDEPLAALRQHMLPSAVLLAGFVPDEEHGHKAYLAELKRIVELPGDIVFVYNAGGVALDA